MARQNRNFKLTIKDLRCFSGEQHFDIRPLTFLVGANSTGKTTVMSCFSTIYKHISQKGFRFRHPDFNKEPYFMGSFIDIARRSKAGGEKKNIQTFEIGISHNNDIKYNFSFKKKKASAEPVIKTVSAGFKNISFFCRKKGEDILCTIKDNKSNKVIRKSEHYVSLDNNNDDISPAWPILEPPYIPRINRSRQDIGNKALEYLHSCTRKLFAESIFDSAPIRSKPQRTYDPIKESPSPEGSEIPVLLSNLRGKTRDWKKLHKNLINFGKASDLFSDIKVRRLGGKTKGDPFQLQFKVRGFVSNIIDTGYGLSQILPLLVRLFDSDIQARHPSKRGTRFLLQQPEVHLHPEAQAELASLFVKSTKINNSFLIETHSDYMLDRTRIEIRKGKIAPDQVSIVYLEPVKDRVKAHNISIDKHGNLIGAPTKYRKFFIKETDRLLGFKD